VTLPLCQQPSFRSCMSLSSVIAPTLSGGNLPSLVGSVVP
jgi:hypothetical protein